MNIEKIFNELKQFEGPSFDRLAYYITNHIMNIDDVRRATFQRYDIKPKNSNANAFFKFKTYTTQYEFDVVYKYFPENDAIRIIEFLIK